MIIALNSPLSGWTENDGSQDELANYVSQLLISKKDMLDDYFSMEITEDGKLVSIPLLLGKHTIPFI